MTIGQRSHLCTVGGIVQVCLGVGVRHARRITTHYVEVRARCHACLSMPLNLQHIRGSEYNHPPHPAIHPTTQPPTQPNHRSAHSTSILTPLFSPSPSPPLHSPPSVQRTSLEKGRWPWRCFLDPERPPSHSPPHPSTHLCRSSVHHWRREDGHDGVLWVQNAILQHSLVLFDAPRQRDVIVLRPAACDSNVVTTPASLESNESDDLRYVQWCRHVKGIHF